MLSGKSLILFYEFGIFSIIFNLHNYQVCTCWTKRLQVTRGSGQQRYPIFLFLVRMLHQNFIRRKADKELETYCQNV